MRRRTILISLFLVLLFLSATALTLGILIKHEPDFYQAATLPEGSERSVQSSEFLSRYSDLKNSILNRYPDWWVVFATEQINAYLQEDIRSHGGDANFPDGFHEPRVRLEDGKLQLGCRYGKGFWSTVLSIDMKVWLVANEPNVVGVEILNLRAGALPASRQIILDYITDMARRSNIDVKWFHRKNNPVAMMRFQADQVRPTIQIQRFELKSGKIVVVGRSTEGHVAHSHEKAGAN